MPERSGLLNFRFINENFCPSLSFYIQFEICDLGLELIRIVSHGYLLEICGFLLTVLKPLPPPRPTVELKPHSDSNLSSISSRPLKIPKENF